jgi:hypothetical protein
MYPIDSLPLCHLHILKLHKIKLQNISLIYDMNGDIKKVHILMTRFNIYEEIKVLVIKSWLINLKLK